MDGPWYEVTGPTAEEVRKMVINKLGAKYSKIVLEVVPDTRNDFGSWRGFYAFGVLTKIIDECYLRPTCA